MTVLYWTLGLVALQRLIELACARNNTVRLRRLGAVEADTEGYPLYVLLHAAWLASLAIFVPAATPPYWPLIGLSRCCVAFTQTPNRAIKVKAWVGFTAMSIGMFMVILDIQIVASSLPEIQAGLGIALNHLS